MFLGRAQKGGVQGVQDMVLDLTISLNVSGVHHMVVYFAYLNVQKSFRWTKGEMQQVETEAPY